MSRIDVEVRFVGPSDAALVCGAIGTFGALGLWWLLYYQFGIRTPDWLALAVSSGVAWFVGFIVGGWVEAHDERAGGGG